MSDLPALIHPAGECLGSVAVATYPVDTPSRFAEVVCADAELLRAEFEALIAANYPFGDGQPRSCPPRRKRPLLIDRARPEPRAISSSRPGLRPRPGGRKGRAGADRVARERGPPPHPPHRSTCPTATSDTEVMDRAISRAQQLRRSTLVTTIFNRPRCDSVTSADARTPRPHGAQPR